MPKRALPGKRPEITLDQHASISLYEQLYERLRSEILAGQLEAGTRLPSTRVLASELGVSRNTAALAYEMLLPSAVFSTSLSNTATRVFRVGQPDVASFPYKVWARLVTKHARCPLHARTDHSHRWSAGALDLLARVLLDPGDIKSFEFHVILWVGRPRLRILFGWLEGIVV